MTDTPIDPIIDAPAPELPAETAVQDNAPQPAPDAPKTITGLFAAIYLAFDEAGRVCKANPDAHPELSAALDGIPQSDLDSLVQNVVATYKNLDNLRVIGLTFQPVGQDIVAVVRMQFGDMTPTLSAPFNTEAATEILGSLSRAITEVSPPSIILPN